MSQEKSCLSCHVKLAIVSSTESDGNQITSKDQPVLINMSDRETITLKEQHKTAS